MTGGLGEGDRACLWRPMNTRFGQVRGKAGDFAAWGVMVLTPLCFSTNLIFGRGTVTEVAPATLAFLRWSLVALVLAPFALPAIRRGLPLGRIGLLGFLGMGICGAVVYAALQVTTATNATLIYTTSPVWVLLIQRLGGRPLGTFQLVGCALAMLGVATIVFEGDGTRLLDLDLNWGDAAILGCAIAWAVYSIAFRDDRLAALPAAALFGIVSMAGAAILLPFALAELVAGRPMPKGADAWLGIGGIVMFSSLLAFGGYQFGLRRFGPQVTSVFMYLLPGYGVVLAIAFLGERFKTFHAVGIALILGGVVLATQSKARGRRW